MTIPHCTVCGFSELGRRLDVQAITCTVRLCPECRQLPAVEVGTLLGRRLHRTEAGASVVMLLVGMAAGSLLTWWAMGGR